MNWEKRIDREWSVQCSLPDVLWREAGCSGIMAEAATDATAKDALAEAILQAEVLNTEL